MQMQSYVAITIVILKSKGQYEKIFINANYKNKSIT